MMRKTDQRRESRTPRYLFLAFFVFLLVLAFFIIRPFITIILASAVIAYVLYPLFRRLSERTRMPRLSAALCILLAIIVLAIPVFFIVTNIFEESYGVYLQVRDTVGGSSSLFERCASESNFVCDIYADADSWKETYGIDIALYARQGIEAVAGKIVSLATSTLLKVPALLFDIFVMIFLVFFMLLDGNNAMSHVRRLLPLTRSQEMHVTGKLKELINATLYGAILMALVQGLVAGLGFILFGVQAPFLWGALVMLAAFIPFFGTALIWVPVVLMMVSTGVIMSDSVMLWKAFGLFLYCLVIVSGIDNILKPKIVGDRARVHPVIILLGVFGGLALFGFAGIVIGPLLLTLFIALIHIYEVEKNIADGG